MIEQEIRDEFKSAVRVELESHKPFGLHVYFERMQAVPVGLGYVPIWKHGATVNFDGNVIEINCRATNRIKVDITHPDSISAMLDALKEERKWHLYP